MNKVVMIIGLAFIGFVIVLAVSIGSRLNEQTVTLLMGLMCGVGVGLPIGAAIGLYIGDRRQHDRPSPPQPIVIMQPPPPPTVSNVPLIPAPYISPQPRSFNIIGDDGSEN
jgi:hypothetical protein